jgi:[acyl-carrier-protein] S-malonyltransferase
MGGKKLAFVFPGQGSQFVGMGRDIVGQSDIARAMFAQANEIMGRDLTGIMFEGPEEELKKTENTQPAVLVFSLALEAELRARGFSPVVVAGHSLGEYAALCSAGMLDFAAVVSLVNLRGELMAEAGKARPGTMAAVMGLDDAKLAEVCAATPGIVVVANYNAPGQTVISGEVPAVTSAMEACKAAGAKRALPLPVSGAFHSPLMEGPNEKLCEAIGRLDFAEPRVPVVSNVDGAAHTAAAEVRDLLERQMVSGVQWTRTVETLAGAGIEGLVEIGPGKVLSGLAKRIAKDLPVFNVGSLDEIGSLPA